MTLRLSNIYTAYDKADVLSDVSIQAEPGKITCILGSNGSGKSTFLKVLAGSVTRPGGTPVPPICPPL